MTYAASREEVLEQLKGDVYSKTGVWDLSKVCLSHVHVCRMGCAGIILMLGRSRYIPSSALSARKCRSNKLRRKWR
jgi:hypothetical protein